MTITKRITSHKTPQGYGLMVWVKDPCIYQGLVRIVNKFFEKLEEDENKQQVENHGNQTLITS